jgi:hypothetical protein
MADPNALSLTALPSGSCGRPCSASSIQNRFSPLVMFLSAGIGIAVNLFIGFGLHRAGTISMCVLQRCMSLGM